MICNSDPSVYTACARTDMAAAGKSIDSHAAAVIHKQMCPAEKGCMMTWQVSAAMYSRQCLSNLLTTVYSSVK